MAAPDVLQALEEAGQGTAEALAGMFGVEHTEDAAWVDALGLRAVWVQQAGDGEGEVPTMQIFGFTPRVFFLWETALAADVAQSRVVPLAKVVRVVTNTTSEGLEVLIELDLPAATEIGGRFAGAYLDGQNGQAGRMEGEVLLRQGAQVTSYVLAATGKSPVAQLRRFAGRLHRTMGGYPIEAVSRGQQPAR